MAEDYSPILECLRKLVIGGSAIKPCREGIHLRHIYQCADLEKKCFRSKKKMEKIVDTVQDMISKTNLSDLNDSNESEGIQDKEISNTSVAENNERSLEESDKNKEQNHTKSAEESVEKEEKNQPKSADESFENEVKTALKDWEEATKEILAAILAGQGQKVLDSLIAASKMSDVCKKVIVLCLLILTKQTVDKKLVASAYSAVPTICPSSSLFLLFLQTNKIYCRAHKRTGWGRGLKRAVRNWYLSWEPSMLALELCRFPSAYTWSHRDVIKLAHLKLKDFPSGTQIVLHSIFSGLEKTKKIFKDDSDASNLLCLLELLYVEKHDITNADGMIERAKKIFQKFHSLTLSDFPSQVLNEAKVLQFILSTENAPLIIDSLIRTDLFTHVSTNKEMGDLLISLIKKENFIANLDTVDILIAYNSCRRRAAYRTEENEKKVRSKWHHNAKPEAEKSAKVTVPKIPTKESMLIIEAIGELLVKTTERHAKTERKALVFIDTTPSLKNYISFSDDHSVCKQIRGIQAASLILLSLASNNRFDIVRPVFFSGTGLEMPSMPKPCAFHFLQTKLKAIAVSTVKVKEALDSAASQKQDTCIVLCCKVTEGIASTAHQSLAELKTKDSSLKIRLIVCGVSFPDSDSDVVPPASSDQPDLLLIQGFSRDTLRTICAFHERVF